MKDVLTRHLWLPPGEQDAMWLPNLDFVTEREPIVRFRNLQDREYRKELRREIWRAEDGALPLPLGPYKVFHYLGKEWPQVIGVTVTTAVATTPTTLGSTTARVFPFILDGGIIVAQVGMATASAVASSMQLGCYDGSGSLMMNSTTIGTSANATLYNPTDFRLAAGIQRFWAITNANLTSATTAYYFSPAFSAASIDYWGTVAATAGGMPASITPGSITKTVGGFPIYTWFQAK